MYADADDTSVDDLAVEHPEQAGGEKTEGENAAALPVQSFDGNAPEPLTKAEEQEFLASGKQTLKYRMNGEDHESPISETGETVLHYFAKSTEESYAPARNVVLRFLALRAKKAAYDQFLLEQNTKKEGDQNADHA